MKGLLPGLVDFLVLPTHFDNSKFLLPSQMLTTHSNQVYPDDNIQSYAMVNALMFSHM